MSYVVNPPETVSLPVAGTEARFPVRTIYCVGRNYADHAVEMGGDPDREPPFFFIKPAFSVLSGDSLQYPAHTADLHHEVELVVAIGTPFTPEDPLASVYGYAVGVDLTRRDLQGEAKAAGRPWESGKSFLQAAPVGAIRPGEGEMTEATISLSVNGETRQQGNVNQMIWKIPEVLVRIHELFELAPGDLVFTGTPAGVGPLLPGDEVSAHIDKLPPLAFSVCSS